MQTKAENVWYRLRSSFWFVPSVISVSAVLLWAALDRADAAQDYRGNEWIYGGSADAARELMSTIAGSIITVTGVAFSVTIVALSLASQQFGPRLLRNFMGDFGNQLVLGTFIGTFVYCLLVLRRIRGDDGVSDGFVPGVSVTVGILLAVICVAMLIYFIHHIAASIQANSIVAAVARDLDEAIDRLYPPRSGDRQRPAHDGALLPAELANTAAQSANARRAGYVQAIDTRSLVERAERKGMYIAIERRPGTWVVPGTPLLSIWPARAVDDDECAELAGAFVLGDGRTTEQDVEFGIDQLVEVAVRALSPSVNDPFTAIVCVDRLGASLAHLLSREISTPRWIAEASPIRVVESWPVTFNGAMDAAFNQIRQFGGGVLSVSLRSLETLHILADRSHTPEQRASILRHTRAFERAAADATTESSDKAAISERVGHVLKALEQAAQRDAPAVSVHS
jgi:uncharacterized membrane protein